MSTGGTGDGGDVIVKIGDLISFQYITGNEALGNLGAEEVLGSRVFIVNENSSSASFQDCVFRVCPMLRYSSRRTFEKYVERISRDLNPDLKKKLENSFNQPTEQQGGALSRSGSMNSLVSYVESVAPEASLEPAVERELADLKAKAEQEEKQNQEEMERLQGVAVVTYGMGIQLQHVKTNKYLTRTLESSDIQKENMRFELSEEGCKKSHFVILPVHKMRTTGESVHVGDQIHIVSLKNNAEYIHISDVQNPADDTFEANVSLTPSRFMVNSFASHVDIAVQENMKAGDVIFLFHKEHEGFLSIPTAPELAILNAHVKASAAAKIKQAGETLATAITESSSQPEGQFAQALSASIEKIKEEQSAEGVGLEDHVVGEEEGEDYPQTPNFSDHEEPVSNAVTSNEPTLFTDSSIFVHHTPKHDATTMTNSGHLWMIEKDVSFRGGAVSYNETIRLKHLATGKYLAVHPAGFRQYSLSTSSELNNDSLFVIVPLLKKTTGEVTFDSLIRIRHSELRDVWIHAQHTSDNIAEGNHSHDAKHSNTFFPVIADGKQHAEDVFNIMRVPADHVYALNHVFTTLPVLKAFLRDCIANGPKELDKMTESFDQAITQLILFMTTETEETDPMTREGIAVPVRQDFIRECGVLDTLIEILRTKGDPELGRGGGPEVMNAICDSKDCAKLKATFRLIYRAIKQACKSNPTNALFFARHILFFQTQMGYEMKSADMFMEIFRAANHEFFEHLPASIIPNFFNLLRQSRRARYLTMLATACTCQGKPLNFMQEKIGQCLLEERENMAILYHVKLIQEDGRMVPYVYQIINGKETDFEKLSEFSTRQREVKVTGKSQQTETARFFEEQISLFAELSKGRNEVVTEDLRKEMSVQLLEVCILDASIDLDLRARFCDLMAALYIDNHPNTPHHMIEYTRSTESISAPPVPHAAAGPSSHHSSASNLDTQETADVEIEIGTHHKIVLSPSFLKGIENELTSINGQLSAESDKNNFILSATTLLYQLVHFGFYPSSQETVDRLGRVSLHILDGRNDDLGNRKRYHTTEKSLLIQKAKLEACKIFNFLFDMEINIHMGTFLRAFAAHENKQESSANEYLSALFKHLNNVDHDFETSKEDGGAVGDDMNEETPGEQSDDEDDKKKNKAEMHEVLEALADLLKYEYKPLATDALKLLTRLYQQREELWANLEKVDLLDHTQMTLAKVLNMQLKYLTETVDEDMHKHEDRAQMCVKILDDILTITHDHEMRTLYQHLLVNMDFIGMVIEKFDLHKGPHAPSINNEVLEKMVAILKEIAVHNHKAQEILFHKLKFFREELQHGLGIPALIEQIFHNNRALCLKADSDLVASFLEPVQRAEYNYSYLAFLKAIVDVDGVPLPGNQAMVMKAISDRTKDVVDPFITEDWRKEISESMATIRKQNPLQSRVYYYTNLLELHAECATGKNHAAELKCQGAFPLSTLSKIYFDETAAKFHPLLASVIHFITESYIDTERPVQIDPLVIERLAFDICKRVIAFTEELEHLEDENQKMDQKHHIDWEKASKHIDLDAMAHGRAELVVLNKQEKQTAVDSEEDALFREEEDFIFRAAIPFVHYYLESSFVSRASEGLRAELNKLKDYLGSLFEMCEKDVLHKRTVSQCMKSLDSHSFSGSKNHQHAHHEHHNEDTHKAAKQIHHDLMVFIEHVKERKDAKSVFLDLGKLLLAKRLTKYLINLCDHADTVTDEDEDQIILLSEGASVLCEVIATKVEEAEEHAEEVRRRQQENKDVESTHAYDKLKTLQRRLGEQGVVHMVLDYISSGQDDLVKRGLVLGSAILECQGGNLSVQRMFYQKLQKCSATVFSELESRIGRAEAEVKDRKTMFKKMRDVYHLISKLEGAEREEAEREAMEELEAGLSETSCIMELLRFLQLLCEGHYSEMQNFLAEQENAPKSINLISRILDYTCSLEKHMDDKIAEIAAQAFCFLTEVTQGPCEENQLRLAITPLFLCANSLLFHHNWSDITNQNIVLELKNTLTITLLSLFEGSNNSSTVATAMLKIIDVDGLFRIINNAIQDDDFVKKCHAAKDKLTKKFGGLILNSSSSASEPEPELEFSSTIMGGDGAFHKLAKTPEICEELSDNNKSLREELKLNAFILLSTLMEEDNASKIKRRVIDPQHAHAINHDAAHETKKSKWLRNFGNMFVPSKPSTKYEGMKSGEGQEGHTKKKSSRKAKAFVPKTVTIQQAMNHYLAHRPDWQAIKRQIGRVEIERHEGLERLYFRIPKVCHYLSSETKKNFPLEVDQDEAEKIQDFVEHADLIIFQMHHNKKLDDSPAKSLFKYSSVLMWLSYLLTCAINLLVLIRMVKPELYDEEGNQIYVLQDETGKYSKWMSEVDAPVCVGLGAALFVVEFLNGFIYLMRDGIIEHRKSLIKLDEIKGHYNATYTGIKPWWLILWNTKQAAAIIHTVMYVQDLRILYYVASLIFAMLGIFIEPVFFCFHIFNLFIGSSAALNVIQAVTKNGFNLIVTALLGIAVMWAFSLIAFVFFNDTFLYGDDGVPVCQHAGSCFLYVVDFGIRGAGMWEGADFPHDDRPWRTVWNLAFMIAINILLLNMIFGIIIDTFSQIREEKNELKEILESRCFICNVEKAQFDRYADGLDAHQNNEHNLWHYLYFLVYLREDKDVSEYTGTEKYVADLLEKQDYSFFPQNKAMVLIKSEREREERDRDVFERDD